MFRPKSVVFFRRNRTYGTLSRGVARGHQGSHCVARRVLNRLSCLRPRCVLLKSDIFFRMGSEYGGGGGESNINYSILVSLPIKMSENVGF